MNHQLLTWCIDKHSSALRECRYGNTFTRITYIEPRIRTPRPAMCLVQDPYEKTHSRREPLCSLHLPTVYFSTYLEV